MDALGALPSDNASLKNELLDFEIDKTHQTLFAAGKLLGTAFLTYLSLLCLTALLVYGRGMEDSVSVPLLALKVSKDLAAAITVLLCQVVQIWVISLLVLTASLNSRLASKIRERYNSRPADSWHMQYPSLFESVHFLILSLPGKQSTVVSWLVYYLYSAVVAFLPYYLSTRVGQTSTFPAALKYPWVVTNTILNASVMIAIVGAAIYLRKSSQEIDRSEQQRAVNSRLSEMRKVVAQMDAQVEEATRKVEERIRETEELQKKLARKPWKQFGTKLLSITSELPLAG